MGLFGLNKTTKTAFPWKPLTSLEELEAIIEQSTHTPVLFFKHSTRCSISSMALSRFESQFKTDTNCELHYVDLLQHRPVSNAIASITEVVHQSPQAIVVYNKEVVYHASHSSINAEEIFERINALS